MLSESQKRIFCAQLLERYGIQIDLNNELLPVFYVAYQSALIGESTTKQNAAEIQRIVAEFEKNTAAKISKIEVKQFRFASPKEAFHFAFGQYGVLGCLLLFLCFSGWVFNRYQKDKIQALERQFQISERQAQVSEGITFLLSQSPITQKTVNDTIWAQIITLYPAKDLRNALAGKNYVFRPACQCIDIPLYFERKRKNAKR